MISLENEEWSGTDGAAESIDRNEPNDTTTAFSAPWRKNWFSWVISEDLKYGFSDGRTAE